MSKGVADAACAPICAEMDASNQDPCGTLDARFLRAVEAWCVGPGEGQHRGGHSRRQRHWQGGGAGPDARSGCPLTGARAARAGRQEEGKSW